MRKGFIHCQIYNQEAQAFLIDEGKFVKFGTNEEIIRLTGNDELIDLNGMFVLPGFVDSHMHLAELGYYLSQLQLLGTSSMDSLKRKFESYLKEHEDATWITGRGYDENQLGGTIDKQLLDELCPEKPCVLTRVDGHVVVVNSKAIEVAQIDENTEVEGGAVHLETGLLEENAIRLIYDILPQPDGIQLRKYIEKAMALANSYGVTTVGSDDFISMNRDYRIALDTFEKMSYQQALTVRVNEQCEFYSPKEFSTFLDDGYTTDVGNDYFKIGPLKLILDGTLGSCTAALRKPYENNPNNKGILNVSDEDLELYTKLACRFNMGVIAHAIGDEAVQKAIDAFKEIVYEGNMFHTGLVHCQILGQDQIDEIIKMKLSCYFQSLFLEDDIPLLEERIGKERAKTCYPFKTLMENTLASNGSDAPVCMPNVIHGISLAVNGVEGAQETLSIQQALDSYTINGAKQLFMDDKIGHLEEGYYADFVVLDQNLLTIQKEEIDQTKVMMTVMNGEIVFER